MSGVRDKGSIQHFALVKFLAASSYDEKNHKGDDQDPPPLEMHPCGPDCLSESDSRVVDKNKPLSSWIVNVRCER